jgi:hypothetical protein
MAQDYDKIFREVLRDIFPAVAQRVLGIPAGQYQPLPADLQYTSEREADQVWLVTPEAGEPFVLHCEFQTSNDGQMLSRMLLYYGFLYYQQKLPVYQFVLYVGKDKAQMNAEWKARNITFAYQLVDLKTFPYQTFLQSTRSEEVLMAVLADFGGEPAGVIAEKIMAKLAELAHSRLELSQRTLQLVRLATLRNLGKTVYNAAQKMAIHIDIKEDALYQIGQEEGMEKGMEKGKLEEKEETALHMLREGFPEEVVVRITRLPAERVTQLRQQLEARQ